MLPMPRIVPLLLVSLCIGCTGDPAGDDDSADDGLGRFTVVALPDTQIYVDDHPEMFEAQTQWIADNAEELDIQFVTHLGDVVDNGPNERQWANARAALDILVDAGVRHGIAMGNHDNQYGDFEYGYGPDVDDSCSGWLSDIDCAGEHFLAAVGPDRFEGEDWYVGASPSGLSSYQSFEFAGHEFGWLHLEVDPRADEREWAQGVLDDHRGALVHMTTHRYLYDYRIVDIMPDPLPMLTGGRNNALIHSLGGQELIYTDSVSADDLFEEFVAVNSSIYMVQCGHVDSEYRQTSENAAGLDVTEIMTDFQSFHPMGGDGWLKLLTYDLDAGTIEVRTYSPTLDEYRANGDGLDVSLQMLEDALGWFGSYLESFGLDPDELEELLDYWTNTEEGRAEYFEAAYGDGQRDSEFVVEIDFAEYTEIR
jgi:hypothetical protein